MTDKLREELNNVIKDHRNSYPVEFTVSRILSLPAMREVLEKAKAYDEIEYYGADDKAAQVKEWKEKAEKWDNAIKTKSGESYCDDCRASVIQAQLSLIMEGMEVVEGCPRTDCHNGVIFGGDICENCHGTGTITKNATAEKEKEKK